MHYALMPKPSEAEKAAYVADLYKSIECSETPMAVVDYLGRRDADGWVKPTTCLRRRYGVRDMRHVKLYNLEVVKLNPKAALNQENA
jgi:hypothetical protein